jgi:hypothetical protein
MRIPQWRLAMLGVALASHALASPACISGASLASYALLGAGGCMVNDELVNNFVYQTPIVSPGVTSPLTASNIFVTPSFTATSYQLFFFTTGSTTADGFTISGNNSAIYEIDFDWDPLVGGAEDDMVANTPVPPGTASVTTSLCAGAAFTGTTCPTNSPTFAPTNTLFVFNNGTPVIPTATTLFPSQVLVVGTKSVIDLESAMPGSSTITGFKTSVFVTPEPATVSLLAAGIAALALRRFRRPRPAL